MKCPCEECIALAVCRLKEYHGSNGILKICEELSSYLHIEIDKHVDLHRKRIKTLYKVMKPVNWELGKLVKNGIGYTILRKGDE